MPMTIHRCGPGWRLEASCRVPAPLADVFPFFADARNLERLTPPKLRFEILTTRDLDMREGLIIDYRIRLGLVPMRWRSEITAWDPPRGFTDEQRRGPYKRWVHRHTFEADGDSTICRDVVDYEVPGGALVHNLFVRRDLERIFAYRSTMMTRIFEPDPRLAVA